LDIKGINKYFLGQIICKPGSLSLHQSFEANIYVLKDEEGGRKKPFVTGYRPQVLFKNYYMECLPYFYSASSELLMLLLTLPSPKASRWVCPVITFLFNSSYLSPSPSTKVNNEIMKWNNDVV